jgi:hypothetical protein
MGLFAYLRMCVVHFNQLFMHVGLRSGSTAEAASMLEPS